jgi:DNA-binding IclR family transcriptional regulator
MMLESKLFLERNRHGKCRLGPRIMQLGLAVLSQLDLSEVARPHLRRLMTETGETAHVGILRGAEVISIVNVQSVQTLRSPSTVGSRTPAHCTALGKAILAFSPPEVVTQFLRKRTYKSYTANTITSAARLRAELERIRLNGYAHDNEEWEKGLRCFGAPLRDSTREVIAAVGVAGSIFRMTTNRTAALSSAVINTAASISASLGYIQNTERKLKP